MATSILSALLLSYGVAVAGAAAEAQIPNEFKACGAFLYDMTQFVDWPAEARKPGETVRIGIYGNKSFGKAMRSMLRNKPFEVRDFDSASGLRWCHMLFVDRAAQAELPRVLRALDHKPVLTVGDVPRFIERGGMIQFCIHDGRVHFQASGATAGAAGLTVSSQVLKLAGGCEGPGEDD